MALPPLFNSVVISFSFFGDYPVSWARTSQIVFHLVRVVTCLTGLERSPKCVKCQQACLRIRQRRELALQIIRDHHRLIDELREESIRYKRQEPEKDQPRQSICLYDFCICIGSLSSIDTKWEDYSSGNSWEKKYVNQNRNLFLTICEFSPKYVVT